MSKYVMSDLHGDYKRFIKMLNLINFCEEDSLYIIGDIFDRGPNPIKIYDYIKKSPNMFLIKGNHEEMFTTTFETGDYKFWELFGGDTTLKEIREKPQMYEYELYKEIKNLPIIMVVDDFILVHAALHYPKNYKELTLDEFIKIQDKDTCLWDKIIHLDKSINGYTIIHGHSPVQKIKPTLKKAKFIRKEGIIYIDCGCNVAKNGCLGCLRLDDLKEFYL